MPDLNRFRFRNITITATCVTAVAVFFWGVVLAALRVRVAPDVLADDRSGAVVASVATLFLWAARWLAAFFAGGGMVYLLDMMLSQRGQETRLRALTGPLRVLPGRRARLAPRASR